jgi:hypothetical protein
MQNAKYKVYHSSEIPMVGEEEEPTYQKPPPQPPKQYSKLEFILSMLFHKTVSLFIK